MNKTSEIGVWTPQSGTCDMNEHKTNSGVWYDGWYISKAGVPVTFIMEPKQGRSYQPFTSMNVYMNGKRYHKTLNRSFTKRGIMSACLNFINEIKDNFK